MEKERIVKLMKNGLISEASPATSIKNFIENLISRGVIDDLKFGNLVIGNESKKLLRRGLRNLSEDELEFLMKNVNWKKFAQEIIQKGIISSATRQQNFLKVINFVKNKQPGFTSYSDVIKKFNDYPFISELYNNSIGVARDSVVPEFVKKLEKEFNRELMDEFELYFEKNYPEMFKRLKGRTLTEKEISLLEKQLKGKYKRGTLGRIWKTAGKTIDESLDEVEKLNSGYVNSIASTNGFSQSLANQYGLQIQELLNNITSKAKHSISENYWKSIKDNLSPDLKQSLESLTEEQRWPYLVDSIPKEERKLLAEEILDSVKKIKEFTVKKLINELQQNLGKIVRFIVFGSTSRYKDMYKLIAQHGKRKGAFRIYWSLIKWKIMVPLVGNTLYALLVVPWKKAHAESAKNVANFLDLPGMVYNPEEYPTDSSVENFLINWLKEIFVYPPLVEKEGNILKHFFELSYADLLPYISNLIPIVVNWWRENYSKKNPVIPTPNDLPDSDDAAVQKFDSIVPKTLTPPTEETINNTLDEFKAEKQLFFDELNKAGWGINETEKQYFTKEGDVWTYTYCYPDANNCKNEVKYKYDGKNFTFISNTTGK